MGSKARLIYPFDQTIRDVEILNVLGQMVYLGKNINASSVQIDVSALKQGIYMGVVSDDKGEKRMFKTLIE